eukprot:5781277-Pleurochrysis_carterae.AAC.4
MMFSLLALSKFDRAIHLIVAHWLLTPFVALVSAGVGREADSEGSFDSLRRVGAGEPSGGGGADRRPARRQSELLPGPFEESSTRTTQPDSEDTPSAPEPRRWPIGTAKWSQLGDVASSKQLSHVLHAGLKQDRNSSRSSLFEVPAPEVKHDSCCAIC